MATSDTSSEGASLHSDADPRPGYLLKRVTVAVRSQLDEVLRPLGLTVPQYACMHALYETPQISGAELARATLVTRQAVYRLLSDLGDRGLIEQEPSPNSHARRVRLTDDGCRLIERAIGPVRMIEDEMFGDFTDAERELFTMMLIRCEQRVRSFRIPPAA